MVGHSERHNLYDSCTFMNEVKAFLKRKGHLLED